MKLPAFICALLFVFSAQAQSTFVPKNLGSGINSAYDEVSPVVSPDRKTIFFSRKDHPQNGYGAKKSADIWISSRQADGTWSTAERSASLNLGQYNYALAFTADGNTLLLHTDEGLSLASKQNETWSAPQKLNIKASSDATLSSDGKSLLYRKGSKLYILEKNENGSWKEAIVAEGVKGKIQAPHLLIDNKTLYYTASRKNKGKDIFVIKRLDTEWTTWSAPVALNDTINTTGNESSLKTNVNGAWGYFSSTANSTGKGDIFEVKLFEDRPYVLVSGKVVNAKTKRVLKGKDIEIVMDGKPVEHTINKDSATFELKVPFGKSHSITAQLFQYGAKPYTIDVSRDKEYREVTVDLEEEPVSFVLLKGKLLIKNTDQTIPASAKAKIVVDGEEIDSAVIDPVKGTYSIKLNHGTLYYVQVSAQHFESLPDVVDLKNVDGYEEITFDLQADAEKMAIVTGRIIDKKTGTVLASGIKADVKVEGVSSVAAIVDSLTSEYELRFPLKDRYTLSAVVADYYPVYETIDVVNETNEVRITHDLIVVPVERGQSVLLNNVVFEPGKTVLNAASFPELDRLAAYLEANPHVKIDIGAHTNPSVKVSTANQAKAVATYLFGKGIAKNRITYHGHGTSKPVASNKTPEGKAMNKRVEFTFVEK
jgi:outer membrane protein OmpA-like peptidoglycan-associated protein